MHSDHQGPASQDDERESFLANIGRIKLHQGSYPDSPTSLTSRMHGAIIQAQEGLGKLLLLLLCSCCSAASVHSVLCAAAAGIPDASYRRKLIHTP
jgi:hypothetical protein